MNTTDRVEELDLADVIKKYIANKPINDFGLDYTDLAECITKWQQSTTPTIQLEEGELDDLARKLLIENNIWDGEYDSSIDIKIFKIAYKAAYQQRSADAEKEKA